MKTRCTPAFTATLATLGLTYPEWRTLAARRRARTRWVRQTIRQVQRYHSGRGIWWQGTYHRHKEEML
jgi:hypothetical protein